MDDARVLVVGAGIAGPVAAVALQRAGFDPVVYEAYDRGASGVGAFLGIGLNGIDALRAVGLDGPVLERGFPTPRMVISNGKGRTLAEFPNGGTLPDGTQALTIARADLYAALERQAAERGIPVLHGKRLADATTTAAGVRVRFTDGDTAHGSVLVGADGIRSRTRTILDPASPTARYVGFLNTAGYARDPDVGGEPGVTHLVFGKRAFLGHVRHPDGTVWWFANPPCRREPDPEALAATPAEEWRAFLRRLFADDDPALVRMIDRTEDIAAGWITYDLPPVPRWHDDRMVLVGDAAHAVSPSVGQGASLAMEDGVVLAQCLRDIHDRSLALARYEQLRRGRVERVAAQGRRNGSGKTVGPAGRLVRDLVLPIVLRAQFRGGRDPFAWIWNHHLEWEDPADRVGSRP